MSPNTNITNIATVVWWLKPVEGTIKLNWDAAIDKHLKKMGVGNVARDNEDN
jgi:hypothetical protein